MSAGEEAAGVSAETEEGDGAEDDEERASPFDARPRLVDPMTTSLGREDELKPFPGPPVPEEPVRKVDSRPLFANICYFTPKHMPSDGLQDEYLAWLSEDSSDRICLPYYLLSKGDFSVELNTSGELLTDDEIAALDEQTGLEDADEEPAMTPMQIQFVLGHMTAARFPSWEAARGWAASDPVQMRDGYGGGAFLHRWMRSEDPALCVKPTGDCEQTFAVHCLDKPASADLRAATRSDHLDWLRDSGRVSMAGPLLADPGDGTEHEEGAPLGSLLVVNGDSLEDVRAWIEDDPYNAAGLFAQVNVAPICIYHLEEQLPL
jgi:hypothetical protein